MMEKIRMVDLNGQYQRIKSEVDAAMQRVVDQADFVNGNAVGEFAEALARYTGARHVIPCANGTDALRLALMALDLQPGDEVVTVPFTFVSTLEVIVLLGLKPVLVDVCPDTFVMDPDQLETAITSKTKAILPVHLFGQCVDMERILSIARAHNLYVVEDACQAIGAEVTFSDGTVHQAGTMGDVGCTSFFPSKNLGCFGDGGAVFTQKDELAAKIRSIANHGMSEKYYYERVGLNSRLDTLQAAILQVKLRHLDEYIAARQAAAARYNVALQNVAYLQTPALESYSTHVYHQYTLRILDGSRKARTERLSAHDIPYAIYYPLPLHLQQAYRHLGYSEGAFPVSEMLSRQVLSLPMHTELTEEQIHHITSTLAVGY
ncbi:MAG: DegT/DnrJ/EryC1/StrS family aminotransferase [Bacteroidales bacterium]|nr:DegT/DnrJ/EryC1/StrS family aminotransferase [Bacteroidales bacterium]MBR6161473.1 DegT/DnrJ/EryC1/StrS family aminotransferase [Bacteroidales bacterium]